MSKTAYKTVVHFVYVLKKIIFIYFLEYSIRQSVVYVTYEWLSITIY